MKYMMEKIELHPKKDVIIENANEIIKLLMECSELDNSEKIMTIELAIAQLNYNLYKISGDND